MAAEQLLGSQTPTHRIAPDYAFTRGDDSIELGGLAGYTLDPYQQEFLRDGLGVVYVAVPGEENVLRERWSAREVGIDLSRQNGKSVIFEVRVLAGLYLFRERRIVYSAHKGETAMDAFSRVADAISSDGELRAEVKQIRTGNGKEYILLHSGQLLKFRTRTAGGGRGLFGDCAILDEDQDLEDDHIAALMPIVSAQENPQLWYGGSAGNQKSTVKARLIRRTERGSPRLVYWRFVADESDDPAAAATWAKTNPAQGRRIDVEAIQAELETMGLAKFSQERLGIGDYPREEGEEWVIPRRRWEKGLDAKSAAVGKVVFAVEVAWSRQAASIGVAGHRSDGGVHLEVIASEAGTLWAVDELKRVLPRHPNLGVLLDPGSPAKTLIGPLRDAGIDIHPLTTTDITTAYGDFYDGFAVEEPTYHHRGGTVLTAGLAQAQVRTLAGATTWKRAGSADVSGLLAVCWAAHGLKLLNPPEYPPPPPRRAPVRRGTRGSDTADLATANF